MIEQVKEMSKTELGKYFLSCAVYNLMNTFPDDDDVVGDTEKGNFHEAHINGPFKLVFEVKDNDIERTVLYLENEELAVRMGEETIYKMSFDPTVQFDEPEI